MPILCEPNATFPVVLTTDKEKPESSRPVFTAKAQSMRGQKRIGETLDLWNDPAMAVDELFDKTLQVLGEVFVGWKNMPEAYEPSKLGDYLNYAEARELLRAVLFASQLDHDAKKN